MPSLTAESWSIPPPKAPHVDGPKVKKPTRPTTDIPQVLLDEAHSTVPVPFNEKTHINFQPPKNVTTMQDIGLQGHGISNTAISDPFPLFTEEAMLQMRAEIFSKPVLENCRYSTDLTPNLIRGLNPNRAPFCFNAWFSPKVLGRISEVAGLELVPVFDYEVANVNISINDQDSKTVSVGDEASAVAWHYDSVPFVCVTMASDCTDMVGGETAVRLPNGQIQRLRGPAMGTAVIMQGRYIYHQALKAFGGRERIAMVTSFRPKSPFVRDETILTGLRSISDQGELYTQYTGYRLEILEERLRAKQKEEHRRVVEHRSYDISRMRHFLQEQKDFLESMLEQIIEVE